MFALFLFVIRYPEYLTPFWCSHRTPFHLLSFHTSENTLTSPPFPICPYSHLTGLPKRLTHPGIWYSSLHPFWVTFTSIFPRPPWFNLRSCWLTCLYNLAVVSCTGLQCYTMVSLQNPRQYVGLCSLPHCMALTPLFIRLVPWVVRYYFWCTVIMYIVYMHQFSMCCKCAISAPGWPGCFQFPETLEVTTFY